MFYAQFEFYDIKFNIFNPNVNEYYYSINDFSILNLLDKNNYLVTNQNVIFKNLNKLLSKLNFFAGLLKSNNCYKINKPLEIVNLSSFSQIERIGQYEKS